jgi:hypothetical protein
MRELSGNRQQACRFCQTGWAGARGARVEGARLVATLLARHETVPITGAKQGPGRDRAHVDATYARRACCHPRFVQPPQLLLASTPEMALRNRHGSLVAVPRRL